MSDLIDLASERLGGAVVAANDEFFASKDALVLAAAPIWREGEYTDRGKWIALQCLMFQMGGVGPMFGQAHHFMRAKKDEIPYGSERYGNEAKRLYGVLDKRLSEAAYLADEYSIADIATYPWVARHEWHRVDLAAFPNVKRWYDSIARRPAVARGMEIPFLN